MNGKSIMKTRLLNLWEVVRTSFWFIPGLMVFSAIGLSFVIVAVDRMIEPEHHRVFGFLYSGGPEGARSILSTIAGSMITVAGVAFSITIVALTLASSQFGPRLLRNFMRDTGNQIVLGTFIATFIYCLLVLRTVYSTGERVYMPGISVTFAMALAVVNVGILIYFIHHVSTSIQADRVIAAVYHELSEHIQQLFPEELGCEFEQSENDRGRPQPTEDRYNHVCEIAASKNGYLQAIDSNSLLKIAGEHDFLIHLPFRPGEFIVAGSTLAKVESAEQFNEDLAEQIVNCFIVGPQRTPEQDVEFAIHQLVEVALRALSPGINDPFTAITCIDQLGSALCCLSDRAFPSPCRYDDEGRLRIISKPLTFEGVTNAAFDQIRQCGSTNIAVTIRLLETLKTIAGHARNSEQRQAILRQADMIARASQESITEKNDRDDVQQRYQALLDVLNEHALSNKTHTFLTQNQGGPDMDRKAFIDKLAAQLKQWDAEIEKLEAKAEKAQADAKADYHQQIEELRDKKQAAQDKLEEVKQAGEEAWEELKSGAEEAFDTMKNAFQTAMSKFK